MKKELPDQIDCTALEDASGHEFRGVGVLGVPHKGDLLFIEDNDTKEGGATFVVEEVVHRSIHGIAALQLHIRRTEQAGIHAVLRP
jgi:hypothetical protein